MPDPANQLRLLPAPQPLVERLGTEFFRTVPRAPGIYKLLDDAGRLIYVGKAQDLRKRLSSYRRTHGQSRKTIRLIHSIRKIEWEICPSDAAARLRENEVLRQQRPRFNRAGTWPTGWYVTFAVEPELIRLALVREATAGCFGAFRGGVRPALLALSQLLWLALHELTEPNQLPFSLGIGRQSSEFRIPHPDVAMWGDPLLAYLAGESDAVLRRLARTPESLTTPFQWAFHDAQMTLLTDFFLRGPRRNRTLRHLFRADSPWLDPADLDDLPIRHQALELQRQGSAHAT